MQDIRKIIQVADEGSIAFRLAAVLRGSYDSLMDATRLADNLKRVKTNIAEAVAKSGRTGEQVCLLAVTKAVDVPTIRQLLELGQRDFGENRVQALLARAEELVNVQDVRWHMIGHLQRNKVRGVLPVTGRLHAVDSLRLAKEIDRVTVGRDLEADVCIEVNVSGEENKFGIPPEAAAELAEQIDAMDRVRCIGLMTMAPFVSDVEGTRPVFARLRELRDEISKRVPDCVELSMGMSNDYAVAIEEGATIVRIGTAISH